MLVKNYLNLLGITESENFNISFNEVYSIFYHKYEFQSDYNIGLVKNDVSSIFNNLINSKLPKNGIYGRINNFYFNGFFCKEYDDNKAVKQYVFSNNNLIKLPTLKIFKNRIGKEVLI